MRTCRTCKEEKTQMEFYSSTKGTLMAECKACVKARSKANRLANIEHYTAYEKARFQRPERKAQARKYLSERRPAEKRRATYLTSNAIRDGRLIRQPCEVCGAEKVEAHHDDYSKPLEVRWLCRKHHLEHHGKQQRAAA